MKNDYFDLLRENLVNYSISDIEQIKKAYDLAYSLHYGQYRESGEEYITHPVMVAKYLTYLNADKDTVIAGLLHDVIEDTKITQEEIESIFNKDVANMVNGVTKLRKMDFTNVLERDLANTRKIITSMNEDLRIIIIKLCDRLHNIRTLDFKNDEKKKKIARETMELFVPLANYIGLRKIRNELEDLSFKYLDFDSFARTEHEKKLYEEKNKEHLNGMLSDIKKNLDNSLIPNSIEFTTRNLYSVYDELQAGKTIENIHNLFGLKIIVDTTENCYVALGNVHSIYHPLNNKFKDYISNPKTNMYSSIHTSVFGPNDLLVQTRIRTDEMDKIATYGLASYWNNFGNDAKKVMKEKFLKDIQPIVEIDSSYTDNLEFIEKIKKELLCKKIAVYSSNGELISLPEGSNIIDFIFTAFENVDYISRVLVNNIPVSLDHILKNNDTVRFLDNEQILNVNEEIFNIANTTHAKNRIKKIRH